MSFCGVKSGLSDPCGSTALYLTFILKQCIALGYLPFFADLLACSALLSIFANSCPTSFVVSLKF